MIYFKTTTRLGFTLCYRTELKVSSTHYLVCYDLEDNSYTVLAEYIKNMLDKGTFVVSGITYVPITEEEYYMEHVQ